jgi:hypothetical protein
MDASALQVAPSMICASCFGNSKLGGFNINWSTTNLETIFGVDPILLSNEECLHSDLQEYLTCGKYSGDFLEGSNAKIN